VLALMIALGLWGPAGARSDLCLEREPGVFENTPGDVSYRLALRRSLVHPVAAVLVMIAARDHRGSANAVSVELAVQRIPGPHLYRVVTTRPKQPPKRSGVDGNPLDEDWQRFEVVRQEAPLGHAAAEALREAWTAALEQPCPPDARRVVTHDGTHYIFAAGSSGETNTPQPGTPMFALTELGRELAALVTGTEAERADHETVIVEHAKALLKRLRR